MTYFWYEKYLDILPERYRIVFTIFRVSNHRLPVEISRNVPINERKCNICNNNCIGDEFRFILECNTLNWNKKNLVSTKFIL